MKVREVMTENPVCCDRNTKIQDVARMMVECDCGAIPVVEDQQSRRPIGIITDRDIVTRIIAQGEDYFQRKAGSAMTEATVTISEDAAISEAESTMRDNQIRRLLVVDEGGACIGIVAEADLIGQISGNELEDVLKGIYEPMRSASAVA